MYLCLCVCVWGGGVLTGHSTTGTAQVRYSPPLPLLQQPTTGNTPTPPWLVFLDIILNSIQYSRKHVKNILVQNFWVATTALLMDLSYMWSLCGDNGSIKLMTVESNHRLKSIKDGRSGLRWSQLPRIHQLDDYYLRAIDKHSRWQMVICLNV